MAVVGSNRYVTNTTSGVVNIQDLGITLSGTETRDLRDGWSLEELAQSSDLLILVASETLQVNDGISDYGIASAIQLLANLGQQFEFDEYGNQKIHIAGNQLDYDKKLIVHASPRPLTPKTYTHYMGRGDDLQSSLHGESDVQFAITCSGCYQEADFKFISDGMVYMRGAAFGWENCAWGVEVSAEMYADVTPLYTAPSGNIYGVDAYHRIYIPASGTYSLAGLPVPVPALDANGNPTGYWNVSDDGTEMTYSATASGAYNLYDIEVQVARFVQKIPMYGTNYTLKSLESDDVEYMPPGYFMRMRIWNPIEHVDLDKDTNTLVTVSGCQPCRFWGYFFAYRESTLP